MNNPNPKPDIFIQIKNRTNATAAMLAAMKLNLFTPLTNGALDTIELAEKLHVNPDKLGPLLYALVFNGLLIEDNGLFSNTPETEMYMVEGKPDYIGNVYKIWMRNLLASLKTAESIRAGTAQAKYDWKNQSKDELIDLYEGMASMDVYFAKELLSSYDFSQCKTLLDAGGGSGTLAIAMTQLHPQLSATVVDFPSVTPITRQFIKNANAAERVAVVSGDLATDPIPGMYDVAFLNSVIQVVSASDAEKIITHVGNVINPDGYLYIFGSGMLEDSRLSPKPAVEMNLVFINTYDHGQSYTEGEFREWLEKAGFENLQFLYDELTIIARKKGL